MEPAVEIEHDDEIEPAVLIEPFLCHCCGSIWLNFQIKIIIVK